MQETHPLSPTLMLEHLRKGIGSRGQVYSLMYGGNFYKKLVKPLKICSLLNGHFDNVLKACYSALLIAMGSCLDADSTCRRN